MTNFIKPGSQAPFKNSSLSVTKNIRHLDKCLATLSMQKINFQCYSGRTLHIKLFASKKQKHRHHQTSPNIVKHHLTGVDKRKIMHFRNSNLYEYCCILQYEK